MIKFFDVELLQYKFTYILDTFACKIILKIDENYIDIIFNIVERNIKTEQQMPYFLKPEFSEGLNVIITKDYMSFEINNIDYGFKIDNFTIEESDFCHKY